MYLLINPWVTVPWHAINNLNRRVSTSPVQYHIYVKPYDISYGQKKIEYNTVYTKQYLLTRLNNTAMRPVLFFVCFLLFFSPALPQRANIILLAWLLPRKSLEPCCTADGILNSVYNLRTSPRSATHLHVMESHLATRRVYIHQTEQLTTLLHHVICSNQSHSSIRWDLLWWDEVEVRLERTGGSGGQHGWGGMW